MRVLCERLQRYRRTGVQEKRHAQGEEDPSLTLINPNLTCPNLALSYVYKKSVMLKVKKTLA